MATEKKLEAWAAEPKVRVRIDGRMDGVRGPWTTLVNRQSLCEIMGWQYGGRAVAVIDGTMALLREGKAVKLTSKSGYSTFQPLADSEDGSKIPASHATIYNHYGDVVQRTLQTTG